MRKNETSYSLDVLIDLVLDEIILEMQQEH